MTFVGMAAQDGFWVYPSGLIPYDRRGGRDGDYLPAP